MGIHGNGFSGFWVSRFFSALSQFYFKGAEAPQFYSFVVPEGGFNILEEAVQYQPNVLPIQSGFFGYRTDYFRSGVFFSCHGEFGPMPADLLRGPEGVKEPLHPGFFPGRGIFFDNPFPRGGVELFYHLF
jgi:hypothetical protein